MRFEVLVIAFLVKPIQACTNKLRTEPVYKGPQTWLLLSSEFALHSEVSLSTYMIVCVFGGRIALWPALTCVYRCTRLREPCIRMSATEQGVCMYHVPTLL